MKYVQAKHLQKYLVLFHWALAISLHISGKSRMLLHIQLL